MQGPRKKKFEEQPLVAAQAALARLPRSLGDDTGKQQ